MAWKNEGTLLPKIAASALAQCICVTLDTVNDQVYTAASNNIDAIGVTVATVPTYGYSAAVQVDKVAKVLVAASVGPGRVSVASSNGAIGPVAAPASSGVPVGTPVYSIGYINEARAAGEYASVFIDPREIV